MRKQVTFGPAVELLTLNFRAVWKALGWMVNLSPRHIFRKGHKDNVSSVVRGMKLLVHSRIFSSGFFFRARKQNSKNSSQRQHWYGPHHAKAAWAGPHFCNPTSWCSCRSASLLGLTLWDLVRFIHRDFYSKEMGRFSCLLGRLSGSSGMSMSRLSESLAKLSSVNFVGWICI